MDEAGPKGSSGGPAGILGFRDYKDIDTLSAQLIGNLVVDERRDAPKHVLTSQPIFAHFPRAPPQIVHRISDRYALRLERQRWTRRRTEDVTTAVGRCSCRQTAVRE